MAGEPPVEIRGGDRPHEAAVLHHHRLVSGEAVNPVWSPKGDAVVYELAESTGNIWMLEGKKAP